MRYVLRRFVTFQDGTTEKNRGPSVFVVEAPLLGKIIPLTVFQLRDFSKIRQKYAFSFKNTKEILSGEEIHLDKEVSFFLKCSASVLSQRTRVTYVLGTRL